MTATREQTTMIELLRSFRDGQIERRNFIKGAVALGLTPALAGFVAKNPSVALAQDGANGELTITLPRTIVALDPHGAQSVEETTAVISAHIHDTLILRDFETGELVPRLAESWEATADTTWTFNLRQDVTFHDGSPFTSEDVRASLERVLELGGPLAPLWTMVDRIETPDEHTVEIHTTEPNGTVPVSSTLLYIAPAAQLDNENFFTTELFGLGAFRFVSWTPDSELRLEANPDYWGGAPGVSAIQVREIPEQSSRVTALETGEIDFTYSIAADQLPTLQDNDDLTIASTPSYRYYFVWFNSSREPFTDPLVRRAMIHALDLDTMAEDLLEGIAVRSTAPIPMTVFGSIPQEPYAYDPDLARSLLEEAGYPDGIDTTIQWNPGAAPQDRELLLTMLSYWNEAGIRVQNLEKERAVWLEDLLALEWDMNFQDNTVRTGDADFTLRRLYTTAANRNGYGNPELDEALNGAASSTDPAEREAQYAEACRIIWEEAVGIFPFELVENYIVNNRVQGFVAAPNAIPLFHTVTIDE